MVGVFAIPYRLIAPARWSKRSAAVRATKWLARKELLDFVVIQRLRCGSQRCPACHGRVGVNRQVVDLCRNLNCRLAHHPCSLLEEVREVTDGVLASARCLRTIGL